MDFLANNIAAGGEGLMFRRARYLPNGANQGNPFFYMAIGTEFT